MCVEKWEGLDESSERLWVSIRNGDEGELMLGTIYMGLDKKVCDDVTVTKPTYNQSGLI